MQKPRKRNTVNLSSKPPESPWKVIRHDRLPREFYCPTADLFDLLETRKSRRKFRHMKTQDISSLLWFTSRHIGSYPEDSNRVKTPIPTAGALASVRIFVLEPSGQVWVYEPMGHKAGVLPVPIEIYSRIHKAANEFFNIGEGTLLLFAASRPFISKYYEYPDSLILRESGVLLGTLGLVAEAFKLAFCPLGTTAEDWLNLILGTSEQLIIPVGAAVVGRR